MKFIDKILACRDFQSRTDHNDLSLFDYYESIDPINTKRKDKDNMDNLELLEKVTEAATFLYVKNNGDTVSPNVLISKLPNKQYYVSLNRYMTPSDRLRKTIVFKAENASLNKALLDVAKWLSKQHVTKTNPLEELGKMFNEPELKTMSFIPPNLNYYR